MNIINTYINTKKKWVQWLRIFNSVIKYKIKIIFWIFFYRPLLKSGSCVDAIVRGVLISMVVTLIDVAHCMFSARPLVGFVIDHAYDVFVITLMCICIATIGWNWCFSCGLVDVNEFEVTNYIEEKCILFEKSSLKEK